jgi:hypothetical protein
MVLGLVLMGTVSSGSAQMEDEIAMMRTLIQTERQAIVAENLGLSDAEGEVFWPVYRDYMTERAKLGDRYTNLIKDYAAAYPSVSDEKAGELMKEFFAIANEQVKLKRKWMDKLGKVLPVAKTMRFLQIENKLDAYMDAALADEIPLVYGGETMDLMQDE